jgi:S-(hydroxymethyl)glutathione dehydrogenase/alcohol dehydrogenase
VNFKAAVLRTAGLPLTIEQLSLASLGQSDVLVRIKATSLCHTDLEAVEGQLASPLPLVPGHEAAGVIEWVGKSVRNKAVGDHVIISWNPHCDH